MGWMLPTDIQAEAIPSILGGGDVLMAAETGSGKTGAFCLPVIQVVHELLRDSCTSPKSGSTYQPASDQAWRMNVHDRDPGLAIDPMGLLCQSRGATQWQGCRCLTAVHKGKHYYEATITDEGLCRIGWSTELASLDIGTDAYSFGFGGTGKKSFKKQFDTYGEPFGLNDTIGCFIDLDGKSVKFSKNGTVFPKAFEIPPSLHESAFFPSVVLKNAEIRFNFGATEFKFPPGREYKAVNQAPATAVTQAASVSSSAEAFTNISSPSAIIIEPSRELAQQTKDQIDLFSKYIPHPKPKSVLLIGGGPNQTDRLECGVDIVVATPGKLIDLVYNNSIRMKQIRFFILDEVDALLNQGHDQDLKRMWNACPKVFKDGKRLQMIVCSATLHNLEVKKFANELMHFPMWIDLKGQDTVPDTVHHVICRVDPSKDLRWKKYIGRIQTDGIHSNDRLDPDKMTSEMQSEAVKILKVLYIEDAIRKLKVDHAIVFCRTKVDCDNLEQYFNSLNSEGKFLFSCRCLHGDRSTGERRSNLEDFKSGRVRFLICTDVAARGIDIRGIPFVFQLTLSDDKANYVHRIGRVGRAERMGLSISLVSTTKEKVWFHKCPNRGIGCRLTQLTTSGGCAVWYDELHYLSEIEEHLIETIAEIQPDFNIPVFEFDGKVVYGAKRSQTGLSGSYHTNEVNSALRELSGLETKAQKLFLGLQVDWQDTIKSR